MFSSLDTPLVGVKLNETVGKRKASFLTSTSQEPGYGWASG